MSDEQYPCYVATCKTCGRVVAASVDKPELIEDTAEFVADLRKDDTITVERKTVGFVRTSPFGHTDDCGSKPK